MGRDAHAGTSVRPTAGAYDVIVVGGGPAGSTAATLVAQRGRSVLLLDRERFPRFRVGESLMPATYWTLERLGVLERMRASFFPKKYSVQFVSGDGRTASPFYFHEFDPHESSQTWQVDRIEFDRMLLQNAVEHGVDVRQQVVVRDVLVEGEDRVVGVAAEFPDGSRREIRASVVVDATGQTGMLARRFRLKAIDPKLRHMSYYARYEGVERPEGIDAGATVIYWTEPHDAWFWFIPLSETTVSIGVVGPTDVLRVEDGKTPTDVFDEQLAHCPTLAARLDGRPRVTEVEAIRDFSYVSRRIAGDGWVLAGDAYGFLDPMYSTGVFFALKSAEFAADAIADALAAGDPSAERLGRHGETYLAGMEAFRRLVYAYYDRDFHFAKFLKKHPECREPLVHLLVGNVWRRPIDGLFEAMGTMCALPEPRRMADLAAAAPDGGS